MENWKETLPPELKDAPSLKDVKDVSSLAKQYVDQQAYLGNAIRIPGPDAKEEDRKAFYDKLIEKVPGVIPAPNPDDKEGTTALWKKLGRPDSKDGYTLPEGIKQEEVNDILDLAFEAGATVQQAQVLVTKAAEKAQQTAAKRQETRQSNLKEISKEWGVTYEDRVATIKNTLKNMAAPDDLINGVETGDVGPATMRWLHSIAAQFKNPGAPPKEGATLLTPNEAQLRISEIMNNKDHPYWNPSSSANAAAIKQMVELHRMVAASRN